MSNTILDKAIAAVPKFGNRIELFTKKLHLAQYADNSIYDYRLKIAQAVLFYKKLPDDFTQDDIEGKRSFRTRMTHKNEKFYYFLRTDVQNQTHAGTVAGCHL